MMKESIVESKSDSRLQPLHNIIFILLLVVLGVGGISYAVKTIEADRQDIALRAADDERESSQKVEIETLKGKLLGADSSEKKACINAAGFHYPEESTAQELVRLRRIEACVNQLEKSEAK